jgi:CheY-like chemotaxis protein
MSHILLVDPGETARRAMQGILARGDHKLAAVDNAEQAWSFIHRNARIDLVFTELNLSDGNGLAFIQRLKNDSLLKLLPVVVYTEHGDRNAVRSAVELRVQNFLVKPYHDDDIFAEIDKAETNPWCNRFFEEEKSFCKLMGYTPEEVHRMLADLRHAVLAAVVPLGQAAAQEDAKGITDSITALLEQAETAGAWGVVDCLNLMATHAGEGTWTAMPADIEGLEYSVHLIAGRLGDESASPDYQTKEEATVESFARERASWLAAPAEGRCPVVPWDQLLREAETLTGCPVIDSAAAAFQMAATGKPSCISPLMDLVARDPGLSAQMLIAANQAHPPGADAFDRIEDARLAVGILGEQRLQTVARNLLIVEERTMQLPPAFNWPRYWTFQRAVARISQIICRDLEFNSLESVARTAGQLHDLGKLILAHLRPAGFLAILEHARMHRLPVATVEKLYLGGATTRLGAHFADRIGLSRRFANVMRWIDDPAAATEDARLVAIISLARALCRHNQVGASGDPILAQSIPLEETAEWQILREGLYPSFNLRKFELQVHAYCGQIRTEFSGHQSGTVGEIVANAVG